MYKNIIQKAILSLQYNGSINGITLQKRISDWANEELIRILDVQIQKADQDNMLVKLDRIDIEIDLLEEEEMTAQLSKKINEKLSVILNDAVLANTYTTRIEKFSLSRSFGQTLLFFLEQGGLPWWSKIDQQINFFEEFEKFIETEPDHQFISSLKILVADKEIQKRIAWQLPGHIFYDFVYWLFPELKTQLPVLISEIEKIRSTGTRQEANAIDLIFKRSVLDGMKTENNNQRVNSIVGSFVNRVAENGLDPFMNRALKEINMTVFKRTISESKGGPQQIASIKEKSGERKNDSGLSQNLMRKGEKGIARSLASEGIYIKNAGLVIIAGFLPHFFKRLEIVNESIITDKCKAACIVQFLASGKEAIAEFELGISKILCGLEMNAAVDTSTIFSEEEKKEVNELLLSAIEYWNILRDTSVEAFRESFLLRDGKLWFEDDEWHLQVEQKSYDMLLQQLPWNINIIRLPWMRYPLRTEWVY